LLRQASASACRSDWCMTPHRLMDALLGGGVSRASDLVGSPEERRGCLGSVYRPRMKGEPTDVPNELLVTIIAPVRRPAFVLVPARLSLSKTVDLQDLSHQTTRHAVQ
jgi:hypothetical protein